MLFAAFFLAVQNTERILIKSFPAVVTELILFPFEKFDELLAVSRTAIFITNGIQVEIQVSQPQLVENFTGHGNNFCISQG